MKTPCNCIDRSIKQARANSLYTSRLSPRRTIDLTDNDRVTTGLPSGRAMMSEKFKHAAWKCEIALAVFEAKILWINGPFRGGKHDMTVFRKDGLKQRLTMLPGKKLELLIVVIKQVSLTRLGYLHCQMKTTPGASKVQEPCTPAT